MMKIYYNNFMKEWIKIMIVKFINIINYLIIKEKVNREEYIKVFLEADDVLN